MSNLYAEKITLSTIKDIDEKILQILNSDKEYFEIDIKELEPILFKFQGGRFDDEYIPIGILKITRHYKTNFIKYFSELTGSSVNEDVLYFDIKRGCLEIDFQSLLETIIKKGIKKMSGAQIAVIIILAIGIWASESSYEGYLEHKEKLHQGEILKLAIQTLKENNYLKSAKNTPPRKAIESLEDYEKFVYGNSIKNHTYTDNDVEKFIIPDEVKIQYKTISEEFYIRNAADKNVHLEVTLRNKNYKSFDAISKLESNMPLLKSLDSHTPVSLKVKIGLDTKGDIVEADIYEVINTTDETDHNVTQ